ncbi:MAG TPA: rhomboid family intramembrane serine protease [Candidatus Krumholzibacteria bacterium]|nr:rhomboid family intramembrane serine protease [Candidatus Krumholzibacteria bacterium]
MPAMLCPSCRKLIGDDEPRCPYCGALRPGLWGAGRRLQRLFGHHLQLVPLITITCIVLYVTSIALDLRAALTPSGGLMGILSPSSRALFLLGMTGRPALEIGHWWTLLTAVYLHGGLLHIFFNVMWIRQLGTFAEEELGPARFFVLYSLAGAGGFLASSLLGNGPSIGASGSIFGLLGAMISFRRRRGGTRDVMTQQFVTWAVVLFAFGLFMRGVDNWAHLGGFVTGFAFGHRVRGAHERPEGRGVQLAALGLLVLTLAGFLLSIVRLLPWFLSK